MQPFQYIDFTAREIEFRLLGFSFDIHIGDQTLTWVFGSNLIEERTFFEKMTIPGIVGCISYNADDLWWITFWNEEGNRVGWWRIMDNGTHEFKAIHD